MASALLLQLIPVPMDRTNVGRCYRGFEEVEVMEKGGSPMWDRRTKFGAQFLCVVVLAGLALALSAQMRAAESQSSQTLIYAAYDGEDTAAKVFQTMKANQKATGEHIESYAIVTKDMKGKVHVRDQRKKDARVGAILGGVIGVLGGPVGAVAGAAAGGSIGYLTGNEVGISKDMIDKMTSSLTPGSSALAVVLDDRWVKDLEKGLQQAQARQVVAEQIAAGAKQPAPAK